MNVQTQIVSNATINMYLFHTSLTKGNITITNMNVTYAIDFEYFLLNSPVSYNLYFIIE